MSIINKNNQQSLLNDIELPLTIVLSNMELCGFLVDDNVLNKINNQLKDELLKLEKDIYFDAGKQFNINSPKQLGIVLFEDLDLSPKKKTKSGYSTNVDVLNDLKDKHPIVSKVLLYRQLSKLKSTYCEGLLKLLGKDNRIHSSFNQTVTATGRISSTEPNLQNIPIRTPVGKLLRKAFVAKEGCVLVDADYSQIELRVLAHIANDKKMIEAFSNGEDIHTVTAASVFGVEPLFVDEKMRRFAKAVNFGIVYGISDFSLAKDLGISRKQAGKYIEDYLENYSGVKKYMEDVVIKAEKDGFVSTLFNRKRRLDELKSSNFNIRSFGKRVALNTPIQGTAADIIKIAMVNTANRLKKENLESKIILQVHDELVIEAPEKEKDIVVSLLKKEMEDAANFKVKLLVDINVADNLYDCK